MIKDLEHKNKVEAAFNKAKLKTKVDVGDEDYMDKAVKEINKKLGKEIIELLKQPR